MSDKLAIVFLLCGVKPKGDTHDPDPRHVRRAVQALRKEGFVANTASAESILAQGEVIRSHQRKAIER